MHEKRREEERKELLKREGLTETHPRPSGTPSLFPDL